MSKAKTNADELDLTSETEATESSTLAATSSVDSAVTVAAVTTTVSSTKSKPTKMGLTRFLQLHPQNIYITAILKLKYKSKVMTEQEWLDVVDEILDTEITA